MFDPSIWSAAFDGLMADMAMSAFWFGVLEIIWIDILLAGDNAVVIALACRNLPKRLRVWGLALGAGVAVVLRIFFTFIVASMMLLPFVKIVGGVALFFVAVKLLASEDNHHKDEDVEGSAHLWRAVRTIAIADVVMSLDNIIAIAAASKGHTALFVFGLAASIPLVVAGAQAVMVLLNRYPILIWAGGGLLGWIAGQVIATDPFIRGFFSGHMGHEFAEMVEYMVAFAGAASVVGIGWMRHRPQYESLAGK